MTKSIDFYFDFISPYSYLAYQKIKLLTEINVIYRPILLGGIHKLGGITAPAFNERKMKNMKNDCEMIAKKNNVQFIWNKNFPINSLSLMRGYIAIEEKFKQIYFDICFDAYWKNNIDISKNENLDLILDKCKIDKNLFYEKIKDNKIKNRLKELTNLAFNQDIFGAPTFIVNKKLFWGQDRLEYAIDEFQSKDS